jgi:proline racemase
MAEKQAWAGRRLEGQRRVLLREPRGHPDLVGALLTEAVSPGAHAGLLFMHGDGWREMSTAAVMAVTTIVLERGLMTNAGGDGSVVYDTPAGTVRASVERHADGMVVSVAHPPAYVTEAGVLVALPAVPHGTVSGGSPRRLRADMAWGGGAYAIVDAESTGLAIDLEHAPELRRQGRAIAAAFGRTQPCDGTIFTGPPSRDGVDLRAVTVWPNGAIDRSPASAMSAVMAVLRAMGLLQVGLSFTAEGVLGTPLTGRLTGDTAVGEAPAVLVEVGGRAWITGDHAFVASADDPLLEDAGTRL